MKKNKSTLFLVISSIVVLISIFFVGFTMWMVGNFGDVSFEQYYFGITGPSGGTPTSVYIVIAKHLLGILVVTAIIVVLYRLFLKKVNIKMWIKKLVLSVVTLCLFLAGGLYMNNKLKISGYLFAEHTNFFEENYVRPTSEIVNFPEKKKNVIIIYLESYETTYFSKELGGDAEVNLLPNLTNILEEPGAVNFSNTEKYGGPLQAPETGYSIAGMFATQSGLPFKVPMNGHEYAENYKFAPGSITLGDILQKEGYNLEFLAGTNATFAGVDNFYQTHGDFNITDHKSAKADGKIPEDYMVWWGYEDSKLYDYSIEKLEEVSKKPEPFGMVIELTDSHFPGGYTDEACPQDFSEPYANSVACSDKMVYDFIEYVKQQDYYKDTVIVLHGDHLSMDQDYFANVVDPNYERTTFNAYLNVDQSMIDQAKKTNRKMATMDVFPTILSAMGVDIKGDRLGIGTDLFSNTPTYYEYYGIPTVDEELSKRSEYFFDTFLYASDKYE